MKNMNLIKELVNSELFTDGEKETFLKQYLLGWSTEEQLRNLLNHVELCNAKYVELSNKK